MKHKFGDMINTVDLIFFLIKKKVFLSVKNNAIDPLKFGISYAQKLIQVKILGREKDVLWREAKGRDSDH